MSKVAVFVTHCANSVSTKNPSGLSRRWSQGSDRSIGSRRSRCPSNDGSVHGKGCNPKRSRSARALSAQSQGLRHRSASVNWSRCRPSCRRRTRFSSIRYARACRSWRSNQPVRTASAIWTADASITAGVYITERDRLSGVPSTELWGATVLPFTTPRLSRLSSPAPIFPIVTLLLKDFAACVGFQKLVHGCFQLVE
jgi:hypothetical protein